MIEDYVGSNPTPENCWRSIVLLGQNVASYKFALAKALLETNADRTLIRLEDLALPYARNICEHLSQNDKQVTSASSKFLDVCRKFNNNEIDEDALKLGTVKLGFINVIDAFHNVAQSEVPRFFVDSRTESQGITLTDNFYELLNSFQRGNVEVEVDARWDLWESAISMGVNQRILEVDSQSDSLFLRNTHKRVSVTNSRDALNGYQKGKCFYCFKEILISVDCDVDHFFPHLLKNPNFEPHMASRIDNVWNLVLSCKDCNRGAGGKFARIADSVFLERLNKRNNYLIDSHHPLRETIIKQTGPTKEKREHFLKNFYHEATDLIPTVEKWKPVETFGESF